MTNIGNCFLCKKTIDGITFTMAAAYWGSLIYKIIENKPMSRAEQQRMQTKAYMDRDKCLVCRRKK